MTDDAKAIEQLQKELADVKGRLPVETPNDPKAVAAWQSEMHELRERRAAAHLPFSRSDLDAMRAAAPDHVVKSIALRDARAPTGPSSAGTSGQTTRVSSNAGIPGSNTSGWRNSTPLGPPPGVNILDRIMDHQDAVYRHERIVEEAQRQALIKEAEKAASDG